MKKQKFTETQVVSILKQYEGGREAVNDAGSLVLVTRPT